MISCHKGESAVDGRNNTELDTCAHTSRSAVLSALANKKLVAIAPIENMILGAQWESYARF